MPIPSVPENNSILTLRPPWQLVYPQVERKAHEAITNIRLAPSVGHRDLIRQVLLHLPRFSTDELSNPHIIQNEVNRLAARIESNRIDYAFWQNRCRVDKLVKKDLVLGECQPDVARVIHERFHYIGSYHEGIHLGLFGGKEREFPMALVSLASMDIRRLEGLFPTPNEKKRILVISRVFAFDWAPRNTISHLLAQTGRWIRWNLPEVETLLTFLNPNLGFSGSAFKASNWNLYLEIDPVSSYIQDDYVPYRVLMKLPESLRGNVKPSLHNLSPLKLLRFDLVPKGLRLEHSHSTTA